jgi:hypothetical protein
VSLSESRLPPSLVDAINEADETSSRAVAVRAGEATMTPEPTERIPTEQPQSADGRNDEVDEMGWWVGRKMRTRWMSRAVVVARAPSGATARARQSV